MTKFLVFLNGFLIISSLLNEAELQDLGMFLQALGGGGGSPNFGASEREGGSSNLLNLLQQATASGQESYETTPYVMEGGNNPSNTQQPLEINHKPTLAPPININQSFFAQTRDNILRYGKIMRSLLVFLVQMLRVGLQMIFRGIFLSAFQGGPFKIIQNYIRLWMGLSQGFIQVFPGMVWDTLTKFVPSLFRG